MTNPQVSLSTIDYEIGRLAYRQSAHYDSRFVTALTIRHHLVDHVNQQMMTTLAEVFVGRREMSREEVKGEKEVEVTVDYPANLWHLLLYTIPFTRRFAKMKAKPVTVTIGYTTEAITNYYIDPLINRYFDASGRPANGETTYRIYSIDGRLTKHGCEIEQEKMDKAMTNGYTPPYERTSG